VDDSLDIVGIFGTGRNGSTLLLRLLDGIPGTYVHPEEVNFLSAFDDFACYGHIRKETSFYAKVRPLMHLNRSLSADVLVPHYQSQVDQIHNEYLSQIEGPHSIETRPDVLSDIESSGELGSEEFIQAFLAAFSNWISGKSRPAVFKSLEVPYIEDYTHLFPRMKCIHIIRNPVDVYASLIRATREKENPVRMPSWYLAGDNLTTVVQKRWLPHARFLAGKPDPTRHKVIRYEDLVVDPVNRIQDVCSWLSWPMPDRPDHLTVLGGHTSRRLPKNVGKVGAETPSQVVRDTSEHFHYDDAVTDAERDMIRLLTYPLARKLGYWEDEPPPAKERVLRAWLTPKQWEFRHSRSLLGGIRSVLSAIQRRFVLFREVARAS
tara:strand:- start:536 stop:1666 length:1131 start_codon:yes stop_codon:yes gene_type:complete